MNKEVIIFGAGKIGRGFIGQLFHRSGYKLWFADASEELVGLLNQEKKYRVDIAGSDGDDTEYISIEGAFDIHHPETIQEVLNRVEILVTSVGANHISSVAAMMKELLKKRNLNQNMNWLICENALHPAARIRETLLEGAEEAFRYFVDHRLGLVETQVLRTGMEAPEHIKQKEPLALRMHDWWSLPLDRDAFVGKIPNVTGFLPRSHFSNELIRKLYTFNGTNGPISYVGWVNGFRILHEAALEFSTFFDMIREESSYGLTREFGIKEEEQKAFMALATKKYTDPALNDPIERNARDLRRKLGRDERLLGPALLCLKHGRKPYAYARAIAAALCYEGSSDPGTLEVIRTIKQEGPEVALGRYCGLNSTDELFRMVMDAYTMQTYILKR